MTKYSKLMESLRGMEPNVCSCAADAIEDLQVRLAESEDTNKALWVWLIFCANGFKVEGEK